MEQALEDGLPLLVESTVNQVNQFGGYTGPAAGGLRRLPRRDSLRRPVSPPTACSWAPTTSGPYPWRGEPAAQAMQKARALAADSVRAGYLKLHLDASMPLGGDALDPRGGLDPALVARREAELAAAAEAAFRGRSPAREPGGAAAPVYVIGTDVPAPGGIAVEGARACRSPRWRSCAAPWSYAPRPSARPGWQDAWSRVRAVVVQPGVEFGDRACRPTTGQRAAGLCAAARALPGLVLEGHSTDYQSPAALRALVEDGVAVLKVGPALTFAMREALFALEHIERELGAGRALPPGGGAGAGHAGRPCPLARLLPGGGARAAPGPALQPAGPLPLLLDRRRRSSGPSSACWPTCAGGPSPGRSASQYLPRQAGRAREGFLSAEPLAAGAGRRARGAARLCRRRAARSPRVTLREIPARSLLRKQKRVDSWFLSRCGMNLYRGCGHDCAYCDGRAEKYAVEGEFGAEVEVKVNAVELLRRELGPAARRRESAPSGFVLLGGGVGDSYQPAEERYGLARRALELLLELGRPVHVLTKSALVERDLDLLARIHERVAGPS